MKIAVVTGASSGLGRDFVRALDLYGYDEIWAVARREKELLSLAEECGIALLTTSERMYTACGKLYAAGLTGGSVARK